MQVFAFTSFWPASTGGVGFSMQTKGRGNFSRLSSGSLCAIIIAMLGALSEMKSASAQVPCRYEVQLLPTPSPCAFWDRYIVPTGISPNGRWVCGFTDGCCFSGNCYESVVVDTTTMQLRFIPRPAGISSSQARDVNDSGYVVGEYGGSIGDFGFIYNFNTNQYVAQLPAPIQGGICSVNAINASNVVCGTRTITGRPEYKSTAFKWSAATGFQDLGLVNGESTSSADINDRADVVGTMVVNSTALPFLWHNNELINLGTLRGFFTVPNALNNSMQVVGRSSLVPGGLNPHAFLWFRGTMADLGTLPGHDISHALSIAPDGTIVGVSRQLKQHDDRAVLWSNSELRDLNGYLPVGVGFQLTSANAINNHNVVAASGYVYPGGIGMSCLLRPIHGPTADINYDCRVNVNDLLLVINEWHQTNSPADINRDHFVDVFDLCEVICQWSPN